MDDVRKWFHYPIEMPLSADGQGPATVGVDAAKITYEVWDQALTTRASFDNLPDAINEAMRLNAALAPSPDARAAGLREAAEMIRSMKEMRNPDLSAWDAGYVRACHQAEEEILARAAEREGGSHE